MPARETPYEFPALNRESFRGLPGMLADALPDRFGNRLIDAWLAETGRSPETFNPVDRLCYICRRGIGALGFEPALRRRTRASTLEVARLVDLANRVLDERASFMTKRFDRDGTGRKIHMQSLGAMRHFDFNDPSAYSYEQAVMTIRDLGLGMATVEEQFRRAVFNVIGRNQDDHVKNISFLMDRLGNWSLSPAYDVTYAYNPDGTWTRDHQMSLAGRRSGFELDDILQFAASVGMKKRRALEILDEIGASVRDWGRHAEAAGVAPAMQPVSRRPSERTWPRAGERAHALRPRGGLAQDRLEAPERREVAGSAANDEPQAVVVVWSCVDFRRDRRGIHRTAGGVPGDLRSPRCRTHRATNASEETS